MDTQDGFIVGIYNYCDRWCERCSLTGRCRVFAEEQRLVFEPPAETTVMSAPALPVGPTGVPVLRSLGAVAAGLEERPAAGEDLTSGGVTEGDAGSDLPPESAALHARARGLGQRFWGWLAPESRASEPVVKDAVEVLQHFAIFVSPKVYRALMGRVDEEWNAPDSDANGSAKAALLGLDRMGDAWLRLAEHGVVSVLEAAPVLTELQYLTAEMEKLFPRARDFVRPGFDEPEAVAMLEWRERG